MAEMPVQPPPAAPAPGQQKIVLPPHRQRAHRPWRVRAREWAHRNLFPSPVGTAMTLAAAALIALIGAGAIWFVFFDADWEVITANRWLLFAGGYDREEAWRLWFCMALVFALIGAAYGTWSNLGRRDHLFIALAGGFVIFLMAHGGAAPWSSIWFLVSVAALYGGYAITARLPRDDSRGRQMQVRIVGALLALSLPIALMVLLIGSGTRADDLDGFVLNLVLAPVGIVGGLLVGIPLALGRMSSQLWAAPPRQRREEPAGPPSIGGYIRGGRTALGLPRMAIRAYVLSLVRWAIRRDGAREWLGSVLRRGALGIKPISWTCTAYIEIIRGAPLLGWLFVALFILGDVIGGSLVVRVMVILAVFTGAYMAEYIRGGLQALPRGQHEAARAVGLTPMQATRLITLPQALRISIPPMVGQAISIWKDTTLVTVILPLRELKGNADSAIAQLEFTPDRIEAYVFVAVVFWMVSFMMSRISQRTERALGVGER